MNSNTSQKNILSIQDIGFSYFENPVLKEINFNIRESEFVGIIGPNGAGKSTLIKIIAALLDNYSGQITLYNQKTEDMERREFAKKVAYVPQSIELNFNFTVQEVVRMGRFPHLTGLFAEDPKGKTAVAHAINNMDLEHLSHRSFTTLSGGEKQRVIIASTLAQESGLLLLDEPTTALDLRHQQMILSMLKKLSKAEQKTILLVTHDINLSAQFCDRLILMSEGAIVADGTPGTVLNFQLIQKVYGVKVYIDQNPFTKSIYILPYSTE